MTQYTFDKQVVNEIVDSLLRAGKTRALEALVGQGFRFEPTHLYAALESRSYAATILVASGLKTHPKFEETMREVQEQARALAREMGRSRYQPVIDALLHVQLGIESVRQSPGLHRHVRVGATAPNPSPAL